MSRRGWRVASIVAVAIAAIVAIVVVSVVLRPQTTGASAPQAQPSPPPTMGSYAAHSYDDEAKNVPDALKSALARDLGITPAEYLADGAAATQAVKVVADLKARGVKVLDSRIDGTKLTVYVSSAADTAAVKAAGATAVIGAPKKPKLHTVFHTADQNWPSPSVGAPYWPLMGGDPYEFEDSVGDGFRCSVGFNGFNASGVREFVSAGHCTTTVSGSVYIATGTAPYDNPSSDGCDFCTPIGAAVAGQGQFGSGYDFGVIGVPGVVTVGALTGWGTGGTTNSDPNSAPAGVNATPQHVTGEAPAENGAVLCKSGSTSGWTCGVILAVDSTQIVKDDNHVDHTVNTIVATTCVLSGDSGGGGVTGSTAVAIASGSTFPVAGDDGGICGNTGAGSDPTNYDHLSVFFPMMSATGQPSVQGQLGSSWTIETGVQTPVVTFPAPGPTTVTVNSTDHITGTIANPTPTMKVSMYLSTGDTHIPWATVSAASGTWSLPLSGGLHGNGPVTIVAFDGLNASNLTGANANIVTNCGGSPFYVEDVRSVGTGDVNCDGHTDLVARDAAGATWLYTGSGYTPPNGVTSTGADAFTGRVALSTDLHGMSAIEPVGDFNGDQYPDMVARDGAGTEWLYPGNGHGYGTPTVLATGWGSMTTIETAGDFNNDGYYDLVTRTAAGVVDLYPGTGSGLGAPVQLATGWQGMTAILGVGDMNRDGYADLAARDSSGNLWLYPGTGGASLGARTSLGGGWQTYTIYPGGDFLSGDPDDLIARDASGGLWLYESNGAGGFKPRTTMGGGWSSFTIAGDSSSIPTILPALLSGGAGDITADENADLVARDSSGALWEYPGNGLNALGTRTQLSPAAGPWTAAQAIVPVGDFTGDGKPDELQLDSSNNLQLYPGNGTSGFGSPTQVGAAADWAGMTAIQGVGDFDGDGWPDVVARDSAGALWLYPNNGAGTGFSTPVALATGWQGMTSIVGPGDWNRDGHVDLIARDASGNLWMYPGSGASSLGARASLGAGWNTLSIAAAGDFNHDGFADLLAATTTGTLYLYPQNPTGGFLARVTLSTALSGYTIAGDGRTIGSAPVNTAPPTVSGSTVPGSTWTVDPGTWTGKPAPTFTYAWLRCTQPVATAFTTVPPSCAAISGAQSATYVTTPADAGKYLSAQLAATNSFGFVLTGAVNTSAMQSGVPMNTVSPTVSGGTTVGSTWTLNQGTWTGIPAPTLVQAWLRCTHSVTSAFTTVPSGCTAISGANGITYVATSADAGKYLTVQMAGSNPSGAALAGAITTTPIQSAAPMNTVAPSVSGATTVGSTWTLNPGTWTGTPAPTFVQAWLRCTSPVNAPFTTVPSGCTAISGANGTSYVATAADAGKYLTVQMAGSNSSGAALAGAPSTTPIQSSAPVNTVAPSVSGTPTIGSTWTLNQGTWTGTPAPTFVQAWLRCTSPVNAPFTTVPAGCTAISGANGTTYVVTSADAGKYLTAQMAGSNSSGAALAGAPSTTPIQSNAPANTVAPTVSGTATVGSTWTLNQGTWTGNPAPTLIQAWLRCTSPVTSTFTTVPAGCTAISGASGITYVATSADLGKYLTAQMAGSNPSGSALSGAISTTAIH